MKEQVEFYKRQQKKGVSLGAIIPILVSPIVAKILYNYRTPEKPDGEMFTFSEFFDSILDSSTQLPVFISLCAIGNLPVFFLLLRKKKDWIAKGVIYSTIGYALVYFILKLT